MKYFLLIILFIINSCSYPKLTRDELVYDNNFEKLLDSFTQFSENVPFYGYLVVNGDDKNIKILKI